MNKREEIARAIARDEMESWGHESEEALQVDLDARWPSWMNLADSVLAALREPTEAMFLAGVLAYMESKSGEAVNDAWRAMIDAARNEA